MNQFITTPLINEQLFKQHSPVTSATDITEFIPYICIAQELYIEPVLGSCLMDELKKQVVENNLSVANSDLIIRIAPALSFYTVYQALPFHWATIVNKGITIRESENSRSVDIKDIAQLRRWMLNDADILRNQLAAFIQKHKDDYPLWKPEQQFSCDCSEENGGRHTFDSGFYFPNTNR